MLGNENFLQFCTISISLLLCLSSIVPPFFPLCTLLIDHQSSLDIFTQNLHVYNGISFSPGAFPDLCLTHCSPISISFSSSLYFCEVSVLLLSSMVLFSLPFSVLLNLSPSYFSIFYSPFFTSIDYPVCFSFAAFVFILLNPFIFLLIFLYFFYLLPFFFMFT